MRNPIYTILLTMNNEFTGKPSKYYLVSYKTDRKGDIFCKYVHDELPYKAHAYKSYTSALSAAQKVLEKDYRILEVSIIRDFRFLRYAFESLR